MDARPPTQPEEGAISVSSESGGADAGRTESPSPVSEKVRGKRAAADELARKKRKMTSAAPLKLGGILLGGDRTTRTQSAAMSEWLDDDGILVAPPPSTEAPQHNMHAEERSKGGEGVPEQQAKGVPEQ